MYHLDGILEMMQASGVGTIGSTIFAYSAPADAKEYVILYPSNDPPYIDPDTPEYYCGKFQTIIRSADYQDGMDKSLTLSTFLTKHNHQVTGMFIKLVRPLYQVRVFRRSDSGDIEFSVTYEIRYIVQS